MILSVFSELLILKRYEEFMMPFYANSEDAWAKRVNYDVVGDFLTLKNIVMSHKGSYYDYETGEVKRI